mmetsp:Transcript_11436/g.18617  ORF Transcript_11436/g.18617 Transcript_11436/m.18617 type:complete len:211 (+) Transcript_11436:831-1463(+)
MRGRRQRRAAALAAEELFQGTTRSYKRLKADASDTSDSDTSGGEQEEEYVNRRVKPEPVNTKELTLDNNICPLGVIFNVNLDPWIVYSYQAICDRGVFPESYTSTILRNSTLYLEMDDASRYELTTQKEKSNKAKDSIYESYEWLKVRNPKELDTESMVVAGIPLPTQHKTAVASNLDWDEILWNSDNVGVRGVTYPVKCIRFLENTTST